MKKYNILLVHNYYQQKAGEARVFLLEKELLIKNGHNVFEFTRDNAEIEKYSFADKIKLASSITYSSNTYDEITELLRKNNIQICHVHNVFPLISLSVYKACKENNVPIVQTLHNYRLKCLNGNFFIKENICEKCLHNKSFINGIVNKCYRNSYLESILMSIPISKGWSSGVWTTFITKYIALTEFAKNKFISMGIPDEKIVVKPNFIFKDKNQISPYIKREYVLFIGSLEEKKGILDYLELADSTPDEEFLIAGDGKLKQYVIEYVKNRNNIKYLGKVNNKEVLLLLKKTKLLIFPSIWYEGFPMVLVEALANGTPILARNIGAMSEIIIDNKNGRLFNDKEELLKIFTSMIKDKELLNSLSGNASLEFYEKYDDSVNYKQLMNIYNDILR